MVILEGVYLMVTLFFAWIRNIVTFDQNFPFRMAIAIF